MKKLTLLLLSGAVAMSAHAQKRNLNSTAFGISNELRNVAIHPEALQAPLSGAPSRTANKGTATPFATEDFSSGTSTSLPTGWVRGGVGGGGWIWTKSAATSTYSGSLGVISSTTAANGWMRFDSDSIGKSLPATFESNLTSPAYNCSGHPSVLLQFQSFYKKLQDSCWVQVSNNNFTTFTEYQVLENNTLPGNGFSANPANVRINISSVAANQASVKLRFRYKNTYSGGTYAWMIDDIALSEVDAVELSARLGSLIADNVDSNSYSRYSSYTNVPASLMSRLIPVLALSNLGTAAQTNVPMNVKIFNGTTQVFNQTATFPSLPVNATDSITDWTGAPITSYTPSGIGSYTAAFSVNPVGEAYPLNNVDTFRFNVTDSLYTTYGPKSAGVSYYIHRPNTHASGEASSHWGARFDIPGGTSDTLTNVSVSFNEGTTAGTTIVGYIYMLNTVDPTAPYWSLVQATLPKTLAAADISLATTIRYAMFNMDKSAGPAILGPGVYTIAFTAVNAPAASTILINASAPLRDDYGLEGAGANGIIGYYGQSSTANNDGLPDFGQGVGIRTGAKNTPLIRAYFGRYIPVTSVSNIPGVTVGTAYPNPANNTISLPVTMKESANVNVMLSNMIGQTLATQNLGQLSANQSKTATFSTSAIANGVYFLTVEAHGARTTTRFVVAH